MACWLLLLLLLLPGCAMVTVVRSTVSSSVRLCSAGWRSPDLHSEVMKCKTVRDLNVAVFLSGDSDRSVHCVAGGSYRNQSQRDAQAARLSESPDKGPFQAPQSDGLVSRGAPWAVWRRCGKSAAAPATVASAAAPWLVPFKAMGR